MRRGAFAAGGHGAFGQGCLHGGHKAGIAAGQQRAPFTRRSRRDINPQVHRAEFAVAQGQFGPCGARGLAVGAELVDGGCKIGRG